MQSRPRSEPTPARGSSDGGKGANGERGAKGAIGEAKRQQRGHNRAPGSDSPAVPRLCGRYRVFD